ncbi:MAG: type II toxin-antitoxin system HicA family toxin [Nitrospira sp.]|jgi:predicted RNA binding protein YcfA (HicA-like mRNA interferase family)
MPPVPLLPPSDVIKMFQRLGWQIVRQKGSHIIMTKPGHLATLSIPNHPEVARGTLRSLIAKAGLTIEQFLDASNK